MNLYVYGLRMAFLLACLVGCDVAGTVYGREWEMFSFKEKVEDYAERNGLPHEIVIPLPENEFIKLRLIPAGKSILGVRQPNRQPVEKQETLILMIIAYGTACLISLLVLLITPTFKYPKSFSKWRFQISLRRLMACAFLAGFVIHAWFNWTQATKILTQCKEIYERDCTVFERYESSKKYWLKLHEELEIMPARLVTIGEPFFLGASELTIRQYALITGTIVDEVSPPSCPIDDRSHQDALAVCTKLSKLCNLTIRLPSQIQWEFACRAGSTTFFWGGEDVDSLLRTDWCGLWVEGVHYIHSGNRPVCQKPPNPFGLYDMQGNVSEWGSNVEPGTFEVLPIVYGGCAGSDPTHCSPAECEKGFLCFTPAAGIRIMVPIDEAFFKSPITSHSAKSDL